MREIMHFLLPKPVSIHSEYFRSRIWNSVVYIETSKIEDTWCRILGHYDAKYDTVPRVFKGQWWQGRCPIHFCGTRMATVTSCTCTGTMTRGTGTLTGSTTTGTPTTRPRFSQLSSFLFRLFGGVLFYELALPAAEHFSDLFEFYREDGILIILEWSWFPQNHEKHF